MICVTADVAMTDTSVRGLDSVPTSTPARLLQAWRAGEFNARLWQDMVKFLPASFEGNLTQPQNALVAHSGTSFTAQHTTGSLHVTLSERMSNHVVSLPVIAPASRASRCMPCCRIKSFHDPNFALEPSEGAELSSPAQA